MEEVLLNTIKYGDLEELQDVLEIPGLEVSFNNNEALRLALEIKKFEMAFFLMEHKTFDISSIQTYEAVQFYKNDQWGLIERLVALGWDINANDGYLLRYIVAEQNIEWTKELLQMKSINVTVGNFAIVNIARYTGNKDLIALIEGCEKIKAFKEPQKILETTF